MEQRGTTENDAVVYVYLRITAANIRFRSQSFSVTIVGGTPTLGKSSTPMSRHGVRRNRTTVLVLF